MSRVDDDRDAARQAERLLIERQDRERRAKESVQADNAFSKRLNESKAQAKNTEQASLAKSAIAHLLDQDEASLSTDDRAKAAKDRGEREKNRDAQSKSGQQRGDGARAASSRQSAGIEAAYGGAGKEADRQGASMGKSGRAKDQREAEAGAEGRSGDSKFSSESLDSRKGDSDKAAAARGGKPKEEELKADRDGKGKQGGGSSQDGGNKEPPAFRFNPNLMAPVPVQQPRKSSGADRLRAIAEEIAQKIVQSVRIGVNKQGQAEFQIDLRSNVLSGLSISVSGSRGKIRAVFSGRDREVLKTIEENKDGLTSLLKERGLTLEELRIEES